MDPWHQNNSSNALFVHIEILWGLLTQDKLPKATDLGTFQELYQQFSNTKKVKQAARKTHPGQQHGTFNPGLQSLCPLGKAEIKRISKNQERLRNLHDFILPFVDFILTNFYRNVYKIKTHPYCSKSSRKFFRKLDLAMLNATGQVPLTRGKNQIFRLPKTGPVLSKFTVAPKGLSIDF
ncbi:hypothetical protein VP01_2374g1 [Puccinia sorghi]|uniref:Uncharacterized protein n=1 Tax=Puccinia sorghi TaxID=27349 RepID=A0A0L6V720_9BASI|nr:hypothetical protein VP01_2374g1 [Puccinia sorghi]